MMKSFKAHHLYFAASMAVPVLTLALFQNCSNMKAESVVAPPNTLEVTSPSTSSIVEQPTPPPTTTISVRPNYGPNLVLQTLSPVIAVRGSGCIMCHANIVGNVMTDLGYGTPHYAFTGTAFYGATLGSGNWTSSTYNGTRLYLGQTNDNLKQIMQSALPSIAVDQVTAMNIAAPSQARVREIGGLDASHPMKFLGNKSTSPPLAGITLKGAFYGNGSAPIVCDGDLVIDGVVWLKDPKIATISGCRIYATHSIFITGPITYSDTVDSQAQNLQLSSATMVAMGVGNGCVNSINYLSRGSTVFAYNPATKNYSTGEFSDILMADARAIGPDLKDAACDSHGDGLSFEHLLINAPFFLNRYTGDLKGSIIAEVAFSTRGRVATYSFDKFFTKTPTLPLLRPDEYLSLIK